MHELGFGPAHTKSKLLCFFTDYIQSISQLVVGGKQDGVVSVLQVSQVIVDIVDF